MKLSVIIPIFNVEATIERCLRSVVDQKVSDMEVILVDDGSEDSSEDIAKRFAEEYSFMQYIRQENAGLSAARNTGIMHSSGEYITFVDSDDELMENTYTPLISMLEQRKDCDILEYSVVKKNDTKEERIFLREETYTDGRTYWLKGRGYAHTYAPNKFFRKTLFLPEGRQPILFREGAIFEDVEFMSRLLRKNPVIVTTSLLGYLYYLNPKGITSTADGEDLATLLDWHLNAAREFDLEFMKPSKPGKRPLVKPEETALYLSLLNIQISVFRKTGEEPMLPDCRVNLKYAENTKMRLKTLALNTSSLKELCKIFA